MRAKRQKLVTTEAEYADFVEKADANRLYSIQQSYYRVDGAPRWIQTYFVLALDTLPLIAECVVRSTLDSLEGHHVHHQVVQWILESPWHLYPDLLEGNFAFRKPEEFTALARFIDGCNFADCYDLERTVDWNPPDDYISFEYPCQSNVRFTIHVRSGYTYKKSFTTGYPDNEEDPLYATGYAIDRMSVGIDEFYREIKALFLYTLFEDRSNILELQ